jgi:two-component system NtrC family sensor kinase
MFNLTTFALTDMTLCGSALRRIGAGAGSMEEVAGRTVRYLYDNLVGEGGERSCALVRFFKTHPYAALAEEDQRYARKMLGGEPASAEMKCLTLLATAGEQPQWNSRQSSAGHRSIPLASAELVAGAPMIARLITQFGLEVGVLVGADAGFLVEAEQKTYNVFFVADAAGSPYIPAQEQFVVPNRIRSVIGFGGLLPTGDLFAVILFSRVTLERDTADLFKPLALNVKVSILPFDDGRIFA